MCKQAAIRFHSWSLPVLILAHTSPLNTSGSCSKAEADLCKPLLATAPLSSLPTLVWMQSGFLDVPRFPSYSSLASSLHLRVKSPVSSQPGSALWPRFASLCGSVCRPAADPQIIIAIIHCFPDKMISLPLILCQSLFLFTSGHSKPGTAITWGKTQTWLKIPYCSVYEMEMYELPIGHHVWNKYTFPHLLELYRLSMFWFWFFFHFVGKPAAAINVMQKLCWAPAVECPIKKD